MVVWIEIGYRISIICWYWVTTCVVVWIEMFASTAGSATPSVTTDVYKRQGIARNCILGKVYNSRWVLELSLIHI